MGQYGISAVRAVELLKSGKINNPIEAWYQSVQEIIRSDSSRKKPCPRGAFLGLCEAGCIKGVNGIQNANYSPNKDYAVNAYNALKNNKNLLDNKKGLWDEATEKSGINQNGQMDVVTTLWKSGLLK